jgi:predicted esterase
MKPADPRVASVLYVAGKLLDVYEPSDRGPSPVVLLWHGSGPDERDVMRTLARALSKRGSVCLVPDWQSDDAAIGQLNLLDSVSFAQRRAAQFGGNSDRITLCGWSLGAKAAADFVLHPKLTGGWHPRAFVGIASSYDVSPFTNESLAQNVTTRTDVPCLLVHGVRDTIVPVERSRQFHRTLQKWGWQSDLWEVETDHAGVIGTRYDPDLGRCVPSDDPARVRALDFVADSVFAQVKSA